jgi:hypothetical protein
MPTHLLALVYALAHALARSFAHPRLLLYSPTLALVHAPALAYACVLIHNNAYDLPHSHASSDPRPHPRQRFHTQPRPLSYMAALTSLHTPSFATAYAYTLPRGHICSHTATASHTLSSTPHNYAFTRSHACPCPLVLSCHSLLPPSSILFASFIPLPFLGFFIISPFKFLVHSACSNIAM